MKVSLRVPEHLKKRIAKRARAQAISAQSFMLEAIREKLAAEEPRAAFHAEAERRLVGMKRTSAGIPAREAFDYLQRRAEQRPVARPRARKIS